MRLEHRYRYDEGSSAMILSSKSYGHNYECYYYFTPFSCKENIIVYHGIGAGSDLCGDGKISSYTLQNSLAFLTNSSLPWISTWPNIDSVTGESRSRSSYMPRSYG